MTPSFFDDIFLLNNVSETSCLKREREGGERERGERERERERREGGREKERKIEREKVTVLHCEIYLTSYFEDNSPFTL